MEDETEEKTETRVWRVPARCLTASGSENNYSDIIATTQRLIKTAESLQGSSSKLENGKLVVATTASWRTVINFSADFVIFIDAYQFHLDFVFGHWATTTNKRNCSTETVPSKHLHFKSVVIVKYSYDFVNFAQYPKNEFITIRWNVFIHWIISSLAISQKLKHNAPMHDAVCFATLVQD